MSGLLHHYPIKPWFFVNLAACPLGTRVISRHCGQEYSLKLPFATIIVHSTQGMTGAAEINLSSFTSYAAGSKVATSGDDNA
eukprot:SAG31_NODE_853_length_11512_cov_42.663279_8_plen_82_part_00